MGLQFLCLQLPTAGFKVKTHSEVSYFLEVQPKMDSEKGQRTTDRKIDRFRRVYTVDLMLRYRVCVCMYVCMFVCVCV